MQNHIRAFIELAVEQFALRGPVYDFGPCGGERPAIAPWRTLFLGQSYVNCGTSLGPGVDRLVDPARLSLADGTAQTVIGVDLLQRVFEPQRVAEELTRILAPGGVMLLAASSGQLDHEPRDYWRLTPNAVGRLLAPLDALLVGWQGAERSPHSVFGIGCKAPLGAGLAAGVKAFIESYQRWLAAADRATPWRRKLKSTVAGWFADPSQPHAGRDFNQVRFALDLPFDGNWKNGLLSPQLNVTTPARLDLS